MEKITGLTNEEVKQRINKNLVNYDTTTPSKSVKQILIENLCTLFNFINLILGISVFLVGSYKSLLFLGVVICNILISTIQEVRAKKTVDKLSVISASKAEVIRNGKHEKIHINEIVLDDVIIFDLGDQIVTDSKILSGVCEVDESFITGEAKTIYKKEGDTLLSGSFVVSGSVTCKVIHVGLDNYTSVISHDAKAMSSEVNSEIMKALNKIVKYVSIALIPIGLLLLYNQFNIDGNTTQNAVVSVVAAMVGMIPEGLILLVSTVLAISVVRLSKKNVLVQDFYSIETLARVDTLCLDKTGTLTEGKMIVHDVIPLNDNKINDIEDVIKIFTTNLKDKNGTFKALIDKFGKGSIKAKDTIPFSSERKYSGVILEKFAYIMGAPEFILGSELSKYKKILNDYQSENRVLALIKTNNTKEVLNGEIKILAFILIRDKVKESAKKTIEYFKENDVDIKVISGDNPYTVAAVAKEVGIDVRGVYDARKVDQNTDLNYIVKEYNVFGRVKPDQKRMLIRALKNNGHVVAMTGDGVNDVLALKEADCGVAMNDGSDAARNVANLVLLDSDFDSMPHIVKEGRRSINNLERSATLFLSKTVYSSLLALIFIFVNAQYPFEPIQMTLVSTLTIGIPAFVLALEPNHERVKNSFFKVVIARALPSGLTTVFNILLITIFASLMHIDVDQTSMLAVVLTIYTALLLIYKISKPLNLLRKTLFIFLCSFFAIVLAVPFLRGFYSMVLLDINSLLILLPLLYITTRIFRLLSETVDKFIEKRSKWFS